MIWLPKPWQKISGGPLKAVDRMKTISVLNAKGGVGKTAIAHLLSRVLGEVNYSVFLMHTDARDEDTPKMVQNRPYLTWALRPHIDPEKAIKDYNSLKDSISDIENCLMVIDGGANRRNVDLMISEASDVILIPVGISDGDIVEGASTLQRLHQHRSDVGLPQIPIKFVLSNWPGERRKLEVVAKTRHIASFYKHTEGLRFETIVTNMPSIISLMDAKKPTINNTLRRVGRDLANEVCADLNITRIDDMLADSMESA